MISCRLILLLGLLLLSVSLLGQTPSEEHDQCNEDFSKMLVSQLVAESGSVADAHKRIKILIRSADFLWPFDEPTSRGYFSDAYKIARDNFREKGFETKKLGDDKRSLSQPVPDHRFDVIAAIAKHDGAWARKLADELMAEFEKEAKDRNLNDQTREISSLLRLAHQSIERDPALSWYLFRRVMRYPLDQHWYFALYSTATIDQSMAAALYSELLQNYRNETPRRLLFLSAYSFQTDRIFGIDKYQYGTMVPAGLSERPDLQRAFLELFFDRIARFAANPEERLRPVEQYRQPEAVYMITALREMEPFVIDGQPFLIQRFAEARARATSLLTEEMQTGMTEAERRNETNALGFDERLERVEKADEEGKLTDAMIINLITWGNKTEEQFEALEPWLDKIKEETVRVESISYYWFLRSKLAIKESRFADSESHAKKVPEVEHRALLAFDLAEAQLKNISDTAAAYQTLNEVAKLVRTAENSPAKARILFGLASKYETINHGFALEELSEAVRVVNRLKDPDMFSTSIFRQIIGKGYAFYAVFSIPGYDLENTFRLISKNDFELALSNARTLDDKFLKTIAVLAVAKNCVEKAKEAKKGTKKTEPKS